MTTLTTVSLKLEQTGSVIMQTLAGLALDTERQRSPGEVAPGIPSLGGLAAIQHLLNTFVVLNVFQFLVLIALAHLDRQRKATATSVASIHESHDEITPDDLYEDRSDSPKSAEYTDDNEDAEGAVRLSMSSREGTLPSVTSPQQTHPLLLTDTERSYFIENPTESNRSLPIPPSDPPKSKQVKRGELFAGLSAALVVFAWALFLGTAWLRLRSKAERERSASTTGVVGP
jgi:hypothetical protein